MYLQLQWDFLLSSARLSPQACYLACHCFEHQLVSFCLRLRSGMHEGMQIAFTLC